MEQTKINQMGKGNRPTQQPLEASVLVRFRVRNLCDADDFGNDKPFKTFDELARWVIEEEGIFGVADDKYEIVRIAQIDPSDPLSATTIAEQAEKRAGEALASGAGGDSDGLRAYFPELRAEHGQRDPLLGLRGPAEKLWPDGELDGIDVDTIS